MAGETILLFQESQCMFLRGIWRKQKQFSPETLKYWVGVQQGKSYLGSSNQEASSSAGKNTGLVLVPCSRMEVCPYSYFQWCGYFWGSWVSFVTADSSQLGSQKLLQRLVSHELTAYLSIFNLFKLSELWPYFQKHVNQIILNRTTLLSLALRIFEVFVRILLIVTLSLN